MLGDGLKMEYVNGRPEGMTLEDLERFIVGARAAGANGDEVVKVEVRLGGKVKKAKVEFSSIPKTYQERAKGMMIIPAQRDGEDAS